MHNTSSLHDSIRNESAKAEITPFNYRYFIEHAARHGGRVLDYGCGRGQMVALGRDRNIDRWGADTFAGYYENWSELVNPAIRDRVSKIQDGHADFPDCHFDLVMSNQVLEHVTDPEASIAEMYRLIRPGGTIIAAYPVTSTWYEGHVGLYFAHHFSKGSKLRGTYFKFARRCGAGLYYPDASPEEWSRLSGKTLDDVCFYYPRSGMIKAFENTFRAPIEDMAADYMRTRLGARVALLPDSVLRLVYQKRAGEILRIRKP